MKQMKASMKVEERDFLYNSPSVRIGYYLFQTMDEMKQIFKQNAKISKSGQDNSHLFENYETRMEQS